MTNPDARRGASRDADHLLAGRPVDGDPALTALVRGLRSLSDAPVTPSPPLYALLSEGFDPAATTAADVPVWAPAAPARAGWRRPAVRLAGLSLAVKVLLGSGVAVASVGTAAGFGALPAPVQDGLAGVVSTLTPFELPRPDDAPPVDVPDAPSSPVERPALPLPPAQQPAAPPVDRPVGPPAEPGEPAAPARPLPEPAQQRPTTPPPAAERPGAPAPERPEPPAAERPTGPAATTPPPAVDRPQPDEVGPAEQGPAPAAEDRAPEEAPAAPAAAPLAPVADGPPAPART